jgi:hypothetical protein
MCSGRSALEVVYVFRKIRVFLSLQISHEINMIRDVIAFFDQ